LKLCKAVRGSFRSDIADVQLDDWPTFEEMIISLRFLEQLSIPSASVEKARRAAEVVRNALEGNHDLDNLGTMQVLCDALNAINNPNNASFIYTTQQRARQLQQRVQRFLPRGIRFRPAGAVVKEHAGAQQTSHSYGFAGLW